VAEIHNNERDGYHRMTIDRGVVSYSPNGLQMNAPRPASDLDGGYVHHEEKVEGSKVRRRSESFKDFFNQPTLFWNSMSEPEKQHIIDAFSFEVGSVRNKQVKQRIVDMFNRVDHFLATQIALNVGATPPTAPASSASFAPSPALSQENTPKSAATRKVAVLAGNGFNYDELSQVLETLKAAGVHAEIVSMNMSILNAADKRQMEVAKSFAKASYVMYDAVYVVGGLQSVDGLLNDGCAIHFINEAFKHMKTIGATNEGIDLLVQSQITGVKMADENSKQPITNLGVVTLRNTSNMAGFCTELIKAISLHRHWARQPQKQTVPA
jgi:catalase